MLRRAWWPPVLAGVALALLAAGEGTAAERAPLTLAPTRAALLLIRGSEAQQALAQHRPGGIDANSPEEAQLLRQCANDETQHPTRGLFWDVITHGWRVLLQPLAASVRDELLKYAAVSDATASGAYYEGGGDTASKAPLSSGVSCLRFTRLTGDGEDVALDFVVGVRLDTTRDAIRLRPLRLFISQGGAKSATGRYSVAIAVRASAVWRDEFAGHEGLIFEQTVASEGIDLKSGSFLKYYPTEGNTGRRVPIIPVSFGTDRSRPFGWAEFGVRVAEVGTPPETLKLLAELLPEPDENVGALIITAARSGIGLH